MKKLLLIAVLLLALVVTFAACTGNGDTETEAETPTATDAPTTPETDPVTDAETDPATETETEPEPETLPAQPEAAQATQTLTSASWDTFFKNDENTMVYPDGGAAAKFTAEPTKLDDTWTAMLFRGWAGSGNADNKFTAYGYRINLGDIVVDENAVREAEEGVIAAGGDTRFCVTIPTEPLKGGMQYVRVYGICADGTAIEILNIWIEGRDLTALEAAQAWDADKAVVTHLSFDELRNGGDGVFTPGQSAGWDGIAKVNETITTLQFWGWVGIKADTIGTFGYSIDGATPVFDVAWNVEAGADVVAAAQGTGAATATRMLVDIPVAGLVGDHTVTVYYKSADESAIAILKEFTVSGPAVLDTTEAGVHNNHVQKDSENADNYSASIAGWMGFDDYTADTLALGWAVDNGAITWDGSINPNCEDAIKLEANAGANGFRYTLKASLTGVEYGAHTVYFYAKLPTGDLCLLHSMEVTTTDPTAVGNSTVNYDSSVDADLATAFTFKAGLFFSGKTDGATYQINGINQMTTTMDGTYVLTVKNLASTDHMGTMFFRGNPNPDFGDPNYYGNASGDVGCAGIYVALIGTELRINVRGTDDAGAAVQHVYTVAMTGKDLKVVDDNTGLYFYEGETLLASVAISGMDGGYATEAVVTIGETTETLTDVCCAATAASDIGFVARYGSSDPAGITFDAVTLTGLPE